MTMNGRSKKTLLRKSKTSLSFNRSLKSKQTRNHKNKRLNKRCKLRNKRLNRWLHMTSCHNKKKKNKHSISLKIWSSRFLHNSNKYYHSYNSKLLLKQPLMRTSGQVESGLQSGRKHSCFQTSRPVLSTHTTKLCNIATKWLKLTPADLLLAIKQSTLTKMLSPDS